MSAWIRLTIFDEDDGGGGDADENKTKNEKNESSIIIIAQHVMKRDRIESQQK